MFYSSLNFVLVILSTVCGGSSSPQSFISPSCLLLRKQCEERWILSGSFRTGVIWVTWKRSLKPKGKLSLVFPGVAALSEEMLLCLAEKKWHLRQDEAEDLAQRARAGWFPDVKGHFISDVQSCSQHCPNGHLHRSSASHEGKCNNHLEIYHFWL